MQSLSDSRGGQPGAPAGGMMPTADSLSPGQKLGRYTLLVPVAQGGMARVWAARQIGQRGFQKVVAIKTIMPALAADEEFERMFLDEARIAAAIHHPNVCEILDLGEVGNVLFLAMEWIDGVSLLALLKARPRTPLADAIAVKIIAEACAGLHAAHELRDEHSTPLNVVHRDVSPHNVLVNIDGTVKVADFGVAKAMGLEHAPTMAGQLKGKVAYMSPEQAIGDTTVDRRSDIFSLGAVLYETVTGHRAWAGANDVARLQNLLAGNIIPPRQVRPDLPQDLEQILAYTLAVDPTRRYQTAEQMRIALEQFLVARRWIVTPTDIAGTVRQLCGRDIEERQARIRHATASMADDVNTPSQGSASLGAFTMQRPATRGMRRSTAAAITFVAGGVTIAGLLGIVALGSLPPKRTAVAATTAPRASAPLPAVQAPKKEKTIVVKPTPDSALVEVNGVVIGSGVRSFARPGPGETHTVVVRAPGYEPQTITIGHDAAETEWSVELRASADAGKPDAIAEAPPPKTAEVPPPKTAEAPPATTKPTPPSTGTGTSGGSTGGPKPTGGKKPGKPPDIPDNPF